MRRPALSSAIALALCAAVSAQSVPRDDLWIANVEPRRGPVQLDRFGFVAGALNVPNSFAFRRAPSGDVWILSAPVLRQLGVANAAGVGFSIFRVPAEPRDLVVAANGNGWVTLADGTVEERTTTGQVVTTLRLPGAGLAAAVDESGRLWFGVENQPAALLSWRDAGTSVSTVGMPSSLGQVVDLVADGRPGGSHVLVAGDQGGEIFDVDRQGVARVAGTIGSGSAARIRALAVAPDGTLRVGADNGLWSFDPATGSAQLLAAGQTTSIVFDSKGGLWAVVQDELVRVDPATGALDFRSVAGAALNCDDASGFNLARVVVPTGDFDGDGVTNRAEIDRGSNPLDPLSLPSLDVDTAEIQVTMGSDAEIRARGDLGWGFVVFGTGRASSPVQIPGIDGVLALQNVIATAVAMPVPGRLTLRVPSSPFPLGPVWMQVLRLPVGAAAPRLSELIAIRITRQTPQQVVETFSSPGQLDTERSAGTWAQGFARPGRLGGVGRLGTFDPTLGRRVAPGVYEFDTVGQAFPADATLFGYAETVTDGLFEFTDFAVPAGVTVRFVGDRPAVLRIRGTARVDGVVDVSGTDVPGDFDARGPAGPPGAPPVGRDGQPGAPGGAGGGAGGRGADGCLGLGAGVGEFSGRPGEDLIAGMRSGYTGMVAGTGGRGGLLWPTTGLRSSVVYNLFFSISGQVGSGGGGGGYLDAGGSGVAVRTFTGVPSDLAPDTLGGVALSFVPAPAGVDALEHFLLGGAGGGGGGSHPLNMTPVQVNGGASSGPVAWHAGAGGAGGGGALGLRVGGELWVGARAALRSRGGSGAVYTDSLFGPPAPGGGGSGGSIVMQVDGLVEQRGVIDLAGGDGGVLNHPQFNGNFVESVGGAGAPGFVRLETPGNPTVAALGQVNGPAVLSSDNVGTLRDNDAWTGQQSKWYPVGSPFAPAWQHYALRAVVDGVRQDFSDDPSAFRPASGPGVPVQLWVQGAVLDGRGQAVGVPGPWRPFVRDLDLDGANAFRFMLLFDRSVSRDVVVDELSVFYRSL